jgi:hypothetical protein
MGRGAAACSRCCSNDGVLRRGLGLSSSSRTLLRSLLQLGLGRGGRGCPAHGRAPVGDKQRGDGELELGAAPFKLDGDPVVLRRAALSLAPRVDGEAVHWRSGALGRLVLRQRWEVVAWPASLSATRAAAPVDGGTGGWGELAAA